MPAGRGGESPPSGRTPVPAAAARTLSLLSLCLSPAQTSATALPDPTAPQGSFLAPALLPTRPSPRDPRLPAGAHSAPLLGPLVRPRSPHSTLLTPSLPHPTLDCPSVLTPSCIYIQVSSRWLPQTEAWLLLGSYLSVLCVRILR